MSEVLSLFDQTSSSNETNAAWKGRLGERLAAVFLERNGYRLVAANFKVPVGRNSQGAQVTGEIDLIALDGQTLCFVEVKTRRSDEFAPVITAVDLRKQRQITRTARVYRRIFNIRDVDHRFDVVTVLMPDREKPSIEIAKGFWQESNFRKASWNHGIWQDYH
jgi:putative endonuclease